MKNIVYGLKDPRNDVFQYIGKSTVGNERALQHLVGSHSDKVNKWIEELKSKWLYPIVEIIEEVEDLDLLPEREKHYIQKYCELNPDLLNVQSVSKDINSTRTEQDEKDFDSIVSAIVKIPSILKTERACRKLTQQQVSEQTGMSRSTISLCENGGNVNIKNVIDYFLFLKGVDIITKQKTQRVRTDH